MDMKYKITSVDGETLIVDTPNTFEEIRAEIDRKESNFILLELNGKPCFMGIDFLRLSYITEVEETPGVGFTLPRSN
jgi:hypothetical protein